MGAIKPFAVERWFAEFEFSVDHNIAESCIKPLTLAEICGLSGEPLEAVLTNAPLGYVDAAGSADLRQQIAGLYPETGVRNVLVTGGAIEANYLLHKSLIAPGNKVICQWPAYQQLHEVATSSGASVKFWRLRRENSFRPDLEELRDLARDGVDLIVINNPHNPTGVMLGASDMQEVARIARDAGAVLHVDEVYNGIFYGDSVPSARSFDPDVVVTHSMSKAFGLSGARIGWVCGPEHIINGCSQMRDYTSICPSYLSERISLQVLKSKSRFLERANTIARQNLHLVEQFMRARENRLAWVKPQAGVVCFPWFTTDIDIEAFCRSLAATRSTLLLPGTCFGAPNHFRLGFGYDGEKLKEGLRRLAEAIDRA